MRIAIIGFGKMARAILDLLPYKNISCTHIVTRESPTQEPSTQCWKYHTIHIVHSIDNLPWNEIDAVIDFSSPDGLLKRVEAITRAQKPLILGTTGWNEIQDKVLTTVKNNNGSLLFGPNFSIGMALYANLCSYAGQLFSTFPDFDVGLYERHHKMKADHPSGTAKMLMEELLKTIPSKTSSVTNLPQGKIDSSQLHVSHSRVGSIPGFHEVIFENATDTVTLTHRASTRAAFAEGALVSALWLIGRKGAFKFKEMIHERLTPYEAS